MPLDVPGLDGLGPDRIAALVRFLPPHKQAAAAARADWLARARPKQIPPSGDWAVFLAMAGRGFGKTLLGAQEAWWHAAWNDGSRVAVVAPTSGDLRRVCFEGDSGILGVVPLECLKGGDPGEAYNRTLSELTFANGSVIQGFSAAEPNRLRGPQFGFAWIDEVAAWERGVEAFDMLSMTMRLGESPRIIATTTPRPVPLIRSLIERAGRDVRIVRGSTYENRDNLAPGFIQQLAERYSGTRLGRQEIEAELLEDVPGAIWTRAMIEEARIRHLPDGLPPHDAPGHHRALAAALGLVRVVVGVDPSGARSDDDEGADEIGIVAAGIDRAGKGYVLEDASGVYSPEGWGRTAAQVYDRWRADRIVAEANFGGGMVESTIRAVRRSLPVTLVSASRGKAVRAEPVAALYEQRKVAHVGVFPKLEDQLVAFTRTGYHGTASPDRADSLVWAITDLMLGDGPSRIERFRALA